MEEIDARVDLKAGLPFPMVIDMPKSGLVETIAAPPTAKGDVRSHLK